MKGNLINRMSRGMLIGLASVSFFMAGAQMAVYAIAIGNPLLLLSGWASCVLAVYFWDQL